MTMDIALEITIACNEQEKKHRALFKRWIKSDIPLIPGVYIRCDPFSEGRKATRIDIDYTDNSYHISLGEYELASEMAYQDFKKMLNHHWEESS